MSKETSKEEIRKKMLEKRKKLTEEEVREKSRKILEKLKSLKEFKEASTVMFYVSLKNEVFTHDIIKECFGKKTVVVPYVANDEIMVSAIDSFEELQPGEYGVLEPKNITPQLASTIDLVIVPGVAFDKKGSRLGFGLGYYDRFLKHVKCHKIGLAYKFQVVDELPSEEHDVKVDKILTD